MNILVTGGAGYIGSVVVEETLRAGIDLARAHVLALDILD